MEYGPITVVGIDVSKGKSTVAVCRPGGQIILSPFVVAHNCAELQKLVETIHKIEGNIRIVMEHTGMYWRPIARVLQQAGFFVSIVNAILIHRFSDNSLRNGLISLLDQTFPGINTVLHSDYRNTKGHFKWVDFTKRFWHRDCVAGISLHMFAQAYQKWCKKRDTDFKIQTQIKFIAVLKMLLPLFQKIQAPNC